MKYIYFQVATHFSGWFENCFESAVLLPDKFSGSTTDRENNFSWSIDQNRVYFDLKRYVPSPWGF